MREIFEALIKQSGDIRTQNHFILAELLGDFAPFADDAAIDIIENIINSSGDDEITQIVCIQALGKIHGNKAEAILIACLADENIYIRLEVCKSLYKIGGIASVSPLVKMITSESNAMVYKKAKKALHKIQERLDAENGKADVKVTYTGNTNPQSSMEKVKMAATAVERIQPQKERGK